MEEINTMNSTLSKRIKFHNLMGEDLYYKPREYKKSTKKEQKTFSVKKFNFFWKYNPGLFDSQDSEADENTNSNSRCRPKTTSRAGAKKKSKRGRKKKSLRKKQDDEDFVITHMSNKKFHSQELLGNRLQFRSKRLNKMMMSRQNEINTRDQATFHDYLKINDALNAKLLGGNGLIVSQAQRIPRPSQMVSMLPRTLNLNGQMTTPGRSISQNLQLNSLSQSNRIANRREPQRPSRQQEIDFSQTSFKKLIPRANENRQINSDMADSDKSFAEERKTSKKPQSFKTPKNTLPDGFKRECDGGVGMPHSQQYYAQENRETIKKPGLLGHHYITNPIVSPGGANNRPQLFNTQKDNNEVMPIFSPIGIYKRENLNKFLERMTPNRDRLQNFDFMTPKNEFMMPDQREPGNKQCAWNLPKAETPIKPMQEFDTASKKYTSKIFKFLNNDNLMKTPNTPLGKGMSMESPERQFLKNLVDIEKMREISALLEGERSGNAFGKDGAIMASEEVKNALKDVVKEGEIDLNMLAAMQSSRVRNWIDSSIRGCESQSTQILRKMSAQKSHTNLFPEQDLEERTQNRPVKRRDMTDDLQRIGELTSERSHSTIQDLVKTDKLEGAVESLGQRACFQKELRSLIFPEPKLGGSEMKNFVPSLSASIHKMSEKMIQPVVLGSGHVRQRGIHYKLSIGT